MGGHTTEVIVRVDGSRLAADVDALMQSLDVDQQVGLPAGCTVRFHDPELQVTSKAKLALGSRWDVDVVQESRTTALFTGEVAALELQRGETGATFTTVRAFDVLHRLQRGRTTTTYQDVTYADVVQRVLGRNKLSAGTVQSAGGVHPHLSQVDESDWQLLQRLAADIGFVLEARDGKVHFRKPPAPGTDLVLVDLDENVLSLDVSVADDEAVDAVQVRGWDERSKEPVVGTSATSGPTTSVPSGLALRAPARAPAARTFVHASNGYSTQAAAKATAEGMAANLADARGEVQALLRGDARLHPGGTLDLRRVGDPFEGRYTISRARHTYRPDEGYEVEVVAGGRRDRTLLGTIGTGQGRSGRSAGPVWPGVVTGVKDPDDLGRVRVRFPWLDDAYESFWARVVHPGAGKGGRGMMWLPEVNDEVLVTFADGDVRRPYVLGGVYNGTDKPDTAKRISGKGEVDRRTLRTRSGHVLDLVDSRGQEAIRLSSGDGKFELAYDAAKGQLSVSCKGMGGVKVDTTGPLELQGQRVKIASKTTMDLNANGPVTVKGAVIKLN